jgi:hypothetical protein
VNVGRFHSPYPKQREGEAFAGVGTFRSPAEEPWLECGVVGDGMPCDIKRDVHSGKEFAAIHSGKKYSPTVFG